MSLLVVDCLHCDGFTMLKLICLVIAIILICDFIRYQMYKNKLNKGVQGLVYTPSFVYICIVTVICQSLLQLQKLVSK